MKKLVLLFIGFISMAVIHAQDITDAVRFSTDNIEGTARFRALSGAFGALGGDLSAIGINPAGSAVFNSGFTSFSISSQDTDNETSFGGFSNNTNEDSFSFNQAGVVFVFKNRNEESPWQKIVLGVNYDQTQNFDDSFLASGITSNSIDSFFLENAQGLRLDEISVLPGESFSEAYRNIGETFGSRHQQALLGFESFILEPDQNTDDNTLYSSNIASGSFDQDFISRSRGSAGKVTFNAAIQHKDNLRLGINLNSHFVNFDRTTLFFESNDNPDSLIREVEFENSISTEGSGFSFQIGGILKVAKVLRLGFTYDSPTWYTLNDETIQFLSVVDDSNSINTFNPGIINIFPNYRLRTPGKITASTALVFGNRGLISFDYSRKDFSNTQLSPNSDFTEVNNNIEELLTVSNTFKIGGEYRYKNWSYRGGYRFEESPYENENTLGDLTGYSLGIGYDFGGTKLDIAFDDFDRDSSNLLFSQGNLDAAQISSDNRRITVTLGFDL